MLIKELYDVIDELAPFKYSKEIVAAGGYDNSGVILDTGKEFKKVLFSLDLSLAAVRRAKRQGAGAVVTHHPAIYNPTKSLCASDPTSAPVIAAATGGLSVISAHLNLDTAAGGTDASLATALGADEKEVKILSPLTFAGAGYGREFETERTVLTDFVKAAKAELGAKRAFVYGSPYMEIKRAASFCGEGAGYAEEIYKNGGINADVIITSDMPHHLIREFVESGYAIILFTHYATENYGFKKFFDNVSVKLNGKAETVMFTDDRFI